MVYETDDYSSSTKYLSHIGRWASISRKKNSNLAMSYFLEQFNVVDNENKIVGSLLPYGRSTRQKNVYRRARLQLDRRRRFAREPALLC